MSCRGVFPRELDTSVSSGRTVRAIPSRNHWIPRFTVGHTRMTLFGEGALDASRGDALLLECFDPSTGALASIDHLARTQKRHQVQRALSQLAKTGTSYTRRIVLYGHVLRVSKSNVVATHANASRRSLHRPPDVRSAAEKSSPIVVRACQASLQGVHLPTRLAKDCDRGRLAGATIFVQKQGLTR